MSGLPSAAELLACDIATVLASEPFGLSCDALAKRVHRRRANVLATLGADPRFVHDGHTRGSCWRLVASGRNGTEWDGFAVATPAPYPTSVVRCLNVAPTHRGGAA